MKTSKDLLDESRSRSGLHDIGDPWPLENCNELLRQIESDEAIGDAGRYAAEAMIARGFDNRLRHVDLLQRHPEIDEQSVEVAAVIASLPRTGSTLLHRMLASVPALTAPIWWETQNYAPFPGEVPGHRESRRTWARDYLNQMLAAMPDLMAAHPLGLDEADEEIMAMGLLFSSTMIEGTFFLPEFARWLTDNSRTRVYSDLRSILQSWQWQDPDRAGKRWVLKTPGHLLALDAVAETFPDARIVMTHRDPVDIVPSFASLTFQFYRSVGEVNPVDVGNFWLERLGSMLDAYLETRDALGENRFCDVNYKDLLVDPLGEGMRVLDEAGVDQTGARDAMTDWIVENDREKRAKHEYSTAEFGLEPDRIRERFADYRARFVEGAA